MSKTRDLSILGSISPTKGFVIVGDGNRWQPIGVGTDGQVIEADSTQANGIKWADASGGAWTVGSSIDTSTGATEYDVTGLPATLTEIDIFIDRVSTNTSSHAVLIQLGDSGGIENTGYDCKASVVGGSSVTENSTDGFLVATNGSAAAADEHRHIIKLRNWGSNFWFLESLTTEPTSGISWVGTALGTKTLSGVLDRFRITTQAGTPTFDNGTTYYRYK